MPLAADPLLPLCSYTWKAIPKDLGLRDLLAANELFKIPPSFFLFFKIEFKLLFYFFIIIIFWYD